MQERNALELNRLKIFSRVQRRPSSKSQESTVTTDNPFNSEEFVDLEEQLPTSATNLNTSINLQDIESIISLKQSGQREADESLMGAGFLGGSSKLMIFFWAAGGSGAGGSLIYLFYFGYSRTTDKCAFSAPLIVAGISTAIALFSLFLIGFLRATFLHYKMYREAYLTLVYLFPLVAISGTVLAINGLVWQIAELSQADPSASQVCSVPDCLSPKVYKVNLILRSLQNASGIITCVFVLCLSYELFKGQMKSAQSYFRYTLAALTFYVSWNSACTFIQPASSAFLRTVCLLFPMASLAAVIFSTYTLNKTKAEAHSLIEKDKASYDAKWDAYLTEDRSKELVIKLQEDICQANCKSELHQTKQSELQQRYWPSWLKISPMSSRSHRRRAALLKPKQVSKDLTCLFAQAIGLSQHFHEHVNSFLVGVSGAEAKHPSGVKKHKRAVEKMYRSYSGDASMLIDLVRSSITCESLDGIISVVNNICGDRHIKILKIKNRFDPKYDSGDSAGYRNLSFSLLLADSVTEQCGVDKHVCELQVGLKVMDDLKNTKGDHGHDNYVKWRDKMAE